MSILTRRDGIKRPPMVLLLLAALAAGGVVIGAYRLFRGLGPTTNLSDGYPWGLWIAFDFFAVPFSAGAFTLAFIVHISKVRKYDAIAHLGLLAGFLGYLMVVLVLILDIGRWDQFYSVLLPWRWNLHSFMFEVSLSITLYFVVLLLELLPLAARAIGKGHWFPVRVVNSGMAVVAGLGVLLSTIHQASIGAIFLSLPHKLHPIWWTPILPILFLTSAVFSGLTVAMLLSLVTWRGLGQRPPMELLSRLARVIAAIMFVYLLLKVGDLVVAGEMGLLFDGSGYSAIWWTEVVIGVVIPMIIFLSRARHTHRGLILGAIYVIVGLALNRSANAWLGLRAPAGYSYTPSWIEIGITVAAVAAAALLYSLGVKYVSTFYPPASKGDEGLTALLSGRDFYG
jgi:Ni/Fe-hydrogenase subunit HybB-like protein